jgi:hypothetical protein
MVAAMLLLSLVGRVLAAPQAGSQDGSGQKPRPANAEEKPDVLQKLARVEQRLEALEKRLSTGSKSGGPADRPTVLTLNPGDDLHAAAAALRNGDVLRLNPGAYSVSRPLRVAKSHVTVEGVGSPNATLLITPKGFKGPLMFCGPEGRTSPLAPSLASGPGQSYVLKEGEDYWLNLRDAVDLDGLGAFTVEFHFRPLIAPGVHVRGILCSQGQLAAGLPTPRCFVIEHVNGTIRAQLTTSQGTATLATPALTVGQVHHLALSWDGTTARLYLDGVQSAAVPLAGTLRQAVWEDVIVGPQHSRWPESSFGVYSTAGHLDGLRFSRVSRYVAPFGRPTKKPIADADTILLLNFDSIDGLLIRGTAGATMPAYFVWMDAQSTVELADVTLRNLRFNSGDASGLHVHNCKSSRFENLVSFYSQCGMKFWNNCYDSEFSSLKATGVAGRSRYGILFARAAFDLNVRRVETFGFTAGLLLSDASGYFAHATCYQTQHTKFAILSKGYFGGQGSLTLDYCTSSDEASPPPDDLVAALGFEGDYVLTLLTPSPQVARTPRPLFRLSGLRSCVIVNPLFRGGPRTPCLVTVAAPLVQPARVRAGARVGTPAAVPLCDVAGAVVQE